VITSQYEHQVIYQ